MKIYIVMANGSVHRAFAKRADAEAYRKQAENSLDTPSFPSVRFWVQEVEYTGESHD